MRDKHRQPTFQDDQERLAFEQRRAALDRKPRVIRIVQKLRHPEDRLPAEHDMVRALLHVPVGAGVPLAALWVDPIIAAVAGLGFLVYEVSEDWRIADHSYQDIAGFVYGIFGGVAIRALIQHYEISWWVLP